MTRQTVQLAMLAVYAALIVAAPAVAPVGVPAQLLALAAGFAAFAAAAWRRPGVMPRDALLPAAPPPGHPQPLPGGFGRALLQRMPAPLLVISSRERLTYVNPAARELLPAATPGAHFSAMIRAPAFVEAMEGILADRADRSFSFTLMRGRERHFEARASFLPAEASGDFGDDDQIIVQIEDRTRDKALLQTRTDFVANASHELRTPLASILGYIETLQGHARDDPAARELFLDIMMKQAQRMQRLVDDLMNLSRIEMSAHQRPRTRIGFHATAAEAAAAMFPQANANDVLLQVELPRDSDGPEILGDRDQLAQVIGNLIDNAIKYGGPGRKVRVAPAAADPRHPGAAGISVIDAGPGIARENIPRLTERFFRVSPAQSRNMGGTGLGLAITKHILTRHGGALDIRSELGHGSTFTIWIPRAPLREPAHEIRKETEDQ